MFGQNKNFFSLFEAGFKWPWTTVLYATLRRELSENYLLVALHLRQFKISWFKYQQCYRAFLPLVLLSVFPFPSLSNRNIIFKEEGVFICNIKDKNINSPHVSCHVFFPNFILQPNMVIEMNLNVRKGNSESFLKVSVGMLLGWKTETVLLLPENY